ncbi:LmeA family phospholipid-binding protein [Geodermatophilus sp. SYSU D00766]
MRTLLVLLALLVALLLVVGLVADPIAEGVAEERVAAALRDGGDLAGTPDVDVAGWPFLTQAVSGTYDDVRISLTAEDLGRPAGTHADVTLRGVHVPLSDVLSGSVQEVPVDRIDGTATLSYALLSERLGAGTVLQREGDGLRVTRTVEVLGYTVPLTAVGRVSLDGQDLVVDVEEAAAAGVDVPDAVVDRADDALDLRYPVALPFGLRLTGVRPADDGVDVAVEATDTVLRVS